MSSIFTWNCTLFTVFKDAFCTIITSVLINNITEVSMLITTVPHQEKLKILFILFYKKGNKRKGKKGNKKKSIKKYFQLFLIILLKVAKNS